MSPINTAQTSPQALARRTLILITCTYAKQKNSDSEHVVNHDRVIILAKGDARHIALYHAWADAMERPHSFISDFDITWVPPPDTALIVTAQQFEEPEALLLREAMRSGIPVLIIADGILEYRNTWLNPATIPGSLYQPVAGHKIAVIGNAQARVLTSWGNAGKCEVVGSPRFDPLLKRESPPPTQTGTARILVATARTPGFTPEQRKQVKTALQDLANWFQVHPVVDGKTLEIVWRLTGGMAQELGIQNGDPNTPFPDLLASVDALITTPSTTMLEGMLLSKPVAVLDYTNSPPYVPATWSITAPAHMDVTIPELLSPPAPKIQFQNMTLHDSLACSSPAIPRMIALIESMLSIASKCRKTGTPLQFPDQILPPSPPASFASHFELSDLYPNRIEIGTIAPSDLQVENAHLLRLARQQQRYITDLITLIERMNRDFQSTAPIYTRILRRLSLPKRPTLETLPPPPYAK